ncbi:MAG: hypothetical protein U5K00_07555 [Melioribacteraceae bacterium]|nr:hypothetical protein [Melioribacteraceae bacterium]
MNEIIELAFAYAYGDVEWRENTSTLFKKLNKLRSGKRNHFGCSDSKRYLDLGLA